MKQPKKLHSFYRPHPRVQYTGELVHHFTGEVFTPARRVKQNHVDECDINNIIAHYKKTGQLKHVAAHAEQGAYAELPDPMEFQDSMNIVRQAEQSFATLPAHVRDRFNNDPQRFLVFMSNADNQDEAIKLGLATRKPESETTTPPITQIDQANSQVEKPPTVAPPSGTDVNNK